MSRSSSDLIAMLRGLEQVTQAILSHQQKVASRRWANSSLRSVTENINTQVEDVVSDAIVQQPVLQVSGV